MVSNDRNPKLNASQVMIVHDCSCSFACHQRRSFRTTCFWGFQSNLTHRKNNCNDASMTAYLSKKTCASQEEGILAKEHCIHIEAIFAFYLI